MPACSSAVQCLGGELGGKADGFVDGSFLDDLAQILGFGGSKFTHAHLVEDNQIELGEFGSIPKIVPARSGDGKILLQRCDAHVEDGFAVFTGVQPTACAMKVLPTQVSPM